jgi:hypothetical protein
MGFNSVFKGLNHNSRSKIQAYVIIRTGRSRNSYTHQAHAHIFHSTGASALRKNKSVPFYPV